MNQFRAIAWLILFTVVLCCLVYPSTLWLIGQTLFAHQANGSLLDRNGDPLDSKTITIGSRLIAQPFTGDEYFQPRPSAASYNAAASAGSNWGANNYLLRERVARLLGPIVRYKGGPKGGQLVGPDIDAWFQLDRFQGKSGIVAQWAQAHPVVAANWVKSDTLANDFVTAWLKANPAEVAEWKNNNSKANDPTPEEMAVPFFVSFSKSHPGTFPVAVGPRTSDSAREIRIIPVKQGTVIQGIFFDMWRQEFPRVDLQKVPADMVMASGSGLDPHITLENAKYQLDRVALNRAEQSKRDVHQVRSEIESIFREESEAPLGGLVGVPIINVLTLNLALDRHFHSR